MFTSGQLGFAGRRLPEKSSPPASICSPELVVGADADLRGANFSPELLLFSCEGFVRRSRTSREMYTSGQLGFAGLRLPEKSSPPANIRSPELVVGVDAVLRATPSRRSWRDSPAKRLSAGVGGPQGMSTSGPLGFAGLRLPEKNSPPANIRSPELVAGAGPCSPGSEPFTGAGTQKRHKTQKEQLSRSATAAEELLLVQIV